MSQAAIGIAAVNMIINAIIRGNAVPGRCVPNNRQHLIMASDDKVDLIPASRLKGKGLPVPRSVSL